MSPLRIVLPLNFYHYDYLLSSQPLSESRQLRAHRSLESYRVRPKSLIFGNRLSKVYLQRAGPSCRIDFTWDDAETVQTTLSFTRVEEKYELLVECPCERFKINQECSHTLASSYVLNAILEKVLTEEGDDLELEDENYDFDEYFDDGEPIYEDDDVSLLVPSFESVTSEYTLPLTADRGLKLLEPYLEDLKVCFGKPDLRLLAIGFLSTDPLLSAADANYRVWPQEPDLKIKLNDDDPLTWSYVSTDQFRYLFSDQRWLTWDQVNKRRSYLNAVPELFNPRMREKTKQKAHFQQLFPWWYNQHEYRLGFHRKSFYLTGEISLFLDFEFFAKEKVDFFFGIRRGPQKSQQFDLFKLNQVEVGSSKKKKSDQNEVRCWPLYDSDLKTLFLQFSCSKMDSEAAILKYGFLSFKNRKIFFSLQNRLENVFQAYQSHFSSFINEFQKRNPGRDCRLLHSLPFPSEFHFNDWIFSYNNQLTDILSLSNGSIINIENAQKNSFLSLDFKTESFKIGQKFSTPQNPTLFLQSTAYFYRIPMSLADRSWLHMLDLSGPDVASRGERRNQDLKFLRHSGSLAYVALEVLHYRKWNRVLDPEKKSIKTDKQLVDYILTQLPQFVFPEEVKTSSESLTLDRFLSGRVYHLVKDTLTEFTRLSINQKKKQIMASDQKFYLFEVESADMVDLLLCDLMTLAQTRGYSLFKKSSDKIFSEIPSFLIREKLTTKALSLSTDIKEIPTNSWGQMGSSLSIWLENARKLQFEIWLHDKPVQNAESGDIRFNLNFGSRKTQKWFDLNPEVYFRGKKISLDESQKLDGQYVLYFEDEYYLVDGRTLPRYNQVIKIWEKLFLNKQLSTAQHATSMAFSMSSQIELISLVLNGVQVQNNPELEKMADYVKYMDLRKDLSAEVKKNKVLLPYQKTGVQWLVDMKNLKLGGILADEMGLGKTAQAITALDLVLSPHKPNLVLMPTSLIYNWQNEIQKFSAQAKSVIISQRDDLKKDFWNQNTIVLASYGMLIEHSDLFLEKDWNAIVFDEAHYLKNSASERFKVASKLKADWRLALTGTPMENRVSEFQNLLALVLQGAAHPVEPDSVEMIKMISKPFVLRRKKSDVGLQLPEKFEETVTLPTDDQFKRLYKSTASALNDQVSALIEREGENKSQLHILAALTKLRQLCSDPRVFKDYRGLSIKNEFLIEKLAECLENGSSILVFTQFLTTLDQLEGDLKKANIKPLRIDGSTPLAKRREIIEQFQNSDRPQILALTLKTGGVGLNLTRANVVFHLDPWWNPAVENQATDRAHRLGQNKNVTSYRLILKDTLEEKIEKLKSEKLELFKSIFDSQEVVESKGKHRLLSRDDFKFLVSTES